MWSAITVKYFGVTQIITILWWAAATPIVCKAVHIGGSVRVADMEY